MAGNKLKQTVAIRTKFYGPKMGLSRLKRSKAKNSNSNLKRTLFFLNVPAWFNHFDDILDIFRPVSDECVPFLIELYNKARHILFC